MNQVFTHSSLLCEQCDLSSMLYHTVSYCNSLTFVFNELMVCFVTFDQSESRVQTSSFKSLFSNFTRWKYWI